MNKVLLSFLFFILGGIAVFTFLILYSNLRSSEPTNVGLANPSPRQVLKKPRNLEVFFSNKIYDPGATVCDRVYPVSRPLGSSTQDEEARLGEDVYFALKELLSGPTDSEKSRGFFNSIPDNVEVSRITIKDNTAYIDFDKNLDEGVAGSCRVTAIRSQIKETVSQFPLIKKVVISIEGETEGILNP